MDLTKITLEDLRSTFQCEGEANSLFEPMRDAYSEHVGQAVTDLGAGYFLHDVKGGSAGDVMLVWGGELVGLYIEHVLMISENHRCKGLSVPLILEAFRKREFSKRLKVSELGKKSIEKAWRVANGHETTQWRPTKIEKQK
jgi:hypothetical protein